MKFMRTVRVPDDGQTYKLPPELGMFPLFNIADFQNELPKEMVEKGGLFIPIYRELSPLHLPQKLTTSLTYRA